MKYGKFDSEQELLKGYEQLEKAFTRKCQQLADLQAELVVAKTAAQTDNLQCNESNCEQSTATVTTSEQSVDHCRDNNPVPDGEQPLDKQARNRDVTRGTNAQASPSADNAPFREEATVTVPDKMSNGSAESVSVAVQQFLQNNPDYILQLLRKAIPFAPNVMSGGGNVQMAAPSRPKTLKEASALARKLFE